MRKIGTVKVLLGVLALMLLYSMTALAASEKPGIKLSVTDIANEWAVELENLDSVAYSVQFDIIVNEKAEGTMEWDDTSPSTYHKMIRKEDGSKTIFTFYVDRLSEISTTGKVKLGALKLTNPSENIKFSTNGEITTLDEKLNATKVTDAELALVDHVWNSEFTVDKAATCTTEGEKSIHCTTCSTRKEITVIPKSEHKYGDWKVTEATCTEAGSRTKTCSVCSDVVTEAIPALGHDWEKEFTVDKAASCTEKGEKSIHCTRCDVRDQVTEIPASEHKYGDWKVTTEATCTETGSRTKTCSVCGDVVTEAIPALGHDWEKEFTVDKAASCTEKGEKSIHCTRCDVRDQVTEIPALEHKYGDWKVTTEATCEEAGSHTKTCSVCSDVVTEAIPALGHDWKKEFTVDKAASCTEKGEKSIHCTRCDVRDQVTEIPALEHKYGDWKVTTEATCEEAGSRTKTCSVCGDVVTEAIPALGHDWKTNYTINKVATCMEDGSKSIYCRRCNEEKDMVKIPALGHNYGEWSITKEATCTDKGIHTKVCMRCPDQISEEIPALGHSAGDWEIEKAPTIFAKGVEVKKCERCDIDLEKRDIKKKKAKVKLNAKSTTMQVKKTSTALKVKSSSAGDTVRKWTSANKKVAQVDKKTGKITAKSVGTTYITVTMKSGVSAKCTVIVQENAVATNKVSFGAKTINLKKGKSMKLQVLRTPISANDKLEFTSSKEKVAEINSKGKVTAKKKGYTTITVKTATGKKATCKVYVS